jgi:hypothetical protein
MKDDVRRVVVSVLDSLGVDHPLARDARRQLAAALPAPGALCAWGLRHVPRVGAALGALAVLASAWLLVARDPVGPPSTSAPWGPLEPVFPDYRTATAWGIAALALIAAGLLVVAARSRPARV